MSLGDDRQQMCPSRVKMFLESVLMAYSLVCGCFDGFRVYAFTLCVCSAEFIFAHTTYGGPECRRGHWLFSQTVSPLQPQSRIDIAVYTRAHS